MLSMTCSSRTESDLQVVCLYWCKRSRSRDVSWPADEWAAGMSHDCISLEVGDIAKSSSIKDAGYEGLLDVVELSGVEFFRS
jgi:hypothetical protein